MVNRPDEQKCPEHGTFLRMQSKQVAVPGPISQEPEAQTWWGCPVAGCAYRVPPLEEDARKRMGL